jgi:hypothetical protein
MSTLVSKLQSPEQHMEDLVGHSINLLRRRGFEEPEQVKACPYQVLAWDPKARRSVVASVVGRWGIFARLVELLSDECVGRMLKYGHVRFEVHGWTQKETGQWWCDWWTLTPEDFDEHSESAACAGFRVT